MWARIGRWAVALGDPGGDSPQARAGEVTVAPNNDRVDGDAMGLSDTDARLLDDPEVPGNRFGTEGWNNTPDGSQHVHHGLIGDSEDDHAGGAGWWVGDDVSEAHVQRDQGSTFSSADASDVWVWMSTQPLVTHGADIMARHLKKADRFLRVVLVEL